MAHLNKKLSKKYGVVPQGWPADSFHLPLATLTEEIKPNIVFLGLQQLSQPRPQFSILSLGQLALKNTILHPLTVRA
jgi:hypothetical protein